MLGIAKISFMICYISANEGSYEQIYANNSIVLPKRLGSVFRDIIFGFIMSDIVEKFLSTLYKREGYSLSI